MFRAATLPGALLLAASLSLMHCGGGSGGSSPAAPAPVAQDAPSALAVTISPGTSVFRLLWVAPTTAFDGYEFEGRVGTGAFVKLHSGLIPNTWHEAYYDASGTGPVQELATYTFRVRVMRGTTASGYSNESGARTSLNAPNIYSPSSFGGQISISWTNNSLVADTLQLERGVGTPATWAPIPNVPFGVTSWIDRDALEGQACNYRVTYSKGSESASAATTYPASVPMIAPSQITATPLVEGVRLNWQNLSQAATEVAVMRSTGLDSYPSYTQVALLPLATTSYQDSQLATGYYTYRLENRKSGATPAASAPIQVVTLPPQNGASVLPNLLSLPQAGILRRSSTGSWFLSDSYQYNVMVRVPSGNAWVDFVPNSVQSWSAPYFLLDSQDQPHLVYTRSVVQGTQEVAFIHAWKDATGWQNEEIARRTLYSSSAMSSYTFTLDAQDQVHLLWLKSNGTLQDLEYAVKGPGGTWIVEALTGMTSASWLGTYRLAVDPTGQPHVVVGAGQDLFHLTRSAGTWSVETVPSNGASVGSHDFLGAVTSAPDAISVLAPRAHQPYDGSYDLLLIRKTGGTWLPEEVVFTTSGYSAFNGTLAANKSGTRFGLYHPSASGNMLRVWTSGIWANSLVGPSNYGTPQLWFDASDKVNLLLPAGWGSSSSTFPYVLYQEQP